VQRLIDSRQLYALVALARRGSFTAAAAEMSLTQPAISHAIKTLEGDMGCRLVDRVGRRVQLTEAGADFFRHAENILREMDAVRADLDLHSKLGRSRLRIGASTTACQLILPKVIRQFQAKFPNCAVRIEPGDHGRQMELLRAGEVDLAIGVEVPGPASEGLEYSPLFEDGLAFFLSPKHRWATLGSVPREAIPHETLILYERTSYSFRILSEYFREEKIILGNFIELGSMEAIKEMAKLGLGAAVLSPWVARDEVHAGELVALPLGRKKLRYRWAIAHWKGRRLAHAEEMFIKLCAAGTAEFGA